MIREERTLDLLLVEVKWEAHLGMYSSRLPLKASNTLRAHAALMKGVLLTQLRRRQKRRLFTGAVCSLRAACARAPCRREHRGRPC